jgi:hypothetical protein
MNTTEPGETHRLCLYTSATNLRELSQRHNAHINSVVSRPFEREVETRNLRQGYEQTMMDLTKSMN